MSESPLPPTPSNPLSGLDEWEDFVLDRYPQPEQESTFRDYGQNVRPGVREFYRLNHTNQTLDFVCAEGSRISAKNSRARMGSGKRWSFSTLWLTTATPTPSSARSST